MFPCDSLIAFPEPKTGENRECARGQDLKKGGTESKGIILGLFSGGCVSSFGLKKSQFWATCLDDCPCREIRQPPVTVGTARSLGPFGDFLRGVEDTGRNVPPPRAPHPELWRGG